MSQKSIQELQQMIEALQKRVDELEKLKPRVDRLEEFLRKGRKALVAAGVDVPGSWPPP